MILDATNICNDVQILKIITIFKSLISFACIVVPVILVVILIIDIIKTISSSDVDSKKIFKSFSKRIIAAVFVFLIPFIIDFVIGIIPTGKLYYRDCYDVASKDRVRELSYENFTASLKKLENSLEGCNSQKAQCYTDSRINYAQAKKDYKLIPKGRAKDTAKQNLDAQKKRLDMIK